MRGLKRLEKTRVLFYFSFWQKFRSRFPQALVRRRRRRRRNQSVNVLFYACSHPGDIRHTDTHRHTHTHTDTHTHTNNNNKKQPHTHTPPPPPPKNNQTHTHTHTNYISLPTGLWTINLTTELIISALYKISLTLLQALTSYLNINVAFWNNSVVTEHSSSICLKKKKNEEEDEKEEKKKKGEITLWIVSKWKKERKKEKKILHPVYR